MLLKCTHSNSVQKVVETLLENEAVSKPSKYGRIVRVKTPQGIIHADWTGYWDMGDELIPAIGYPVAGGRWTHGMLHQGDEILDSVPFYEEWREEKKRHEEEHAALLAQMRREI